MEFRIWNRKQKTENSGIPRKSFLRIPNSKFLNQQVHVLDAVPPSAQRGTSLLELLIYIAILSGLMVVIVNMFVMISKGRGQSEARSEVNSAIRFATERIRQDVKGASAVTAPLLGAPGATLQMTVGGVVILYDTLAGQLRRKEGAASPVAVTGTSVFVDTPTFTRLENNNTTPNILTATTTAIQVAMTFRYNASSTDWVYADTLRTTISLR